MKIALCIIATGRYTRFLPTLVDSAAAFFCRGHETRLFLFTDDRSGLLAPCSSLPAPFPPLPAPCSLLPARHEPWPGVTLHRHGTLLQAEGELEAFDYVFHCDADMRFDAAVGDEILGDGLTAVIHAGFAGRPRSTFTYERRPQSSACVAPGEGERYYAGGFQGGRVQAYLEAMRTMRERIDRDERRGIMPLWHDESHWNRYLIDRPPSVVLSPLYCSHASWNVPGRRLVALDKNHAEVRT